MRGVFVTGTGTEVGKTVVAAVIARMSAASGASVNVFKPAVSGLDDYPTVPLAGRVWSNAPRLPDHLLLMLAAESSQSEDEIAPYRFGPAVSPHLGAELAAAPIEPAKLLEAATEAGAGADLLVCEGVGGFLVPLADDYLVRDLARALELPIVIAAGPGLGTINHTLLTVEAVRSAGLEVLMVVLTPWPEVPGELELSNLRSIERLAAVPVKTLPTLDLTRPESWPRL
ncbi:MAG: dethiobiotin synthase [Solirubrobacterales bacterium]|nr:dethiobiotin synthase [Solirubrobacterales bacterium]